MTPFLYKVLIVIVFVMALISLSSGFYFLIKDGSKKNRAANALLVRVALCALLVILIVYGIYADYLLPQSPIGLAK